MVRNTLPRPRPNTRVDGSEIVIQRHRHSRGFTVLPNALLQERQLLSRRAKGLLVELLSLPDGWRTNTERLAGPHEGRDAIRAAVREIEAAGYMRRTKHQDKAGRWSMRWVLTDDPTSWDDDETAGQTDDGFSGDGLTCGNDAKPQVRPTTDFQASENQASVERTQEKEPKTKNQPPPPPPAQTQPPAVPEAREGGGGGDLHPDAEELVDEEILHGIAQITGQTVHARKSQRDRLLQAVSQLLEAGMDPVRIADEVLQLQDAKDPLALAISRAERLVTDPPVATFRPEQRLDPRAEVVSQLLAEREAAVEPPDGWADQARQLMRQARAGV